MKILDYITMANLQKQKIPYGLAEFANDINSEVFVIEDGGVVVIAESKKLSNKLKDEFSMFALGQLDKGFVKGAETKEELIENYSQLLVHGCVNLTGYSSSLTETLKKNLKNIYGPELDKE